MCGERFDAAADHGPCPRCAADEWVTWRPDLWSGTLTWLQSGGRWRAATAVCGQCGAAAPYTTGWLISAGSERPWTLPGRLIRAGWGTFGIRRTAEPHPWLYVASASAGAVVGGVASTVARSGRLPLGALTGSGAGLVICWSTFAQTALTAPGLGQEMWTAMLQEAAPKRALRRRLDEDNRMSRTAHFPVYGLSQAWTGPRQLAGYSLSGAPGRQRTVKSLVVAHGDLRSDRLWLTVETTMPNGGYRSFDLDWVERSLARHLRDDLEHRLKTPHLRRKRAGGKPGNKRKPQIPVRPGRTAS